MGLRRRVGWDAAAVSNLPPKIDACRPVLRAPVGVADGAIPILQYVLTATPDGLRLNKLLATNCWQRNAGEPSTRMHSLASILWPPDLIGR